MAPQTGEQDEQEEDGDHRYRYQYRDKRSVHAVLSFDRALRSIIPPTTKRYSATTQESFGSV